jgi:P-type Cu+ transporter
VLDTELVAGRQPVAAAWDGGRDPVCGMALVDEQAAPAETRAGNAFRFCSEQCRERFRRDPGRYATAAGALSGTASDRVGRTRKAATP